LHKIRNDFFPRNVKANALKLGIDGYLVPRVVLEAKCHDISHFGHGMKVGRKGGRKDNAIRPKKKKRGKGRR
jgi:hypothetical protein